jgi:hypothetical protein
MILASRTSDISLVFETIFCFIFWVAATGVADGEISGKGTLKVGVADADVTTVVGMGTVWVETCTVSCGGGGGGGEEAGT